MSFDTPKLLNFTDSPPKPSSTCIGSNNQQVVIACFPSKIVEKASMPKLSKRLHYDFSITLEKSSLQSPRIEKPKSCQSSLMTPRSAFSLVGENAQMGKRSEDDLENANCGTFLDLDESLNFDLLLNNDNAAQRFCLKPRRML